MSNGNSGDDSWAYVGLMLPYSVKRQLAYMGDAR
jgi:hypothetical protein